uniref:Flagellin n=1 Tax=Aquifex pyrophilus TaxID=2714 RepID=FLAA_AQUPY|nr:RecName: Full=Flagellin [Aquifex pyrophilus]AAA88923.1 FlaA [Aquifex pyrophilus]
MATRINYNYEAAVTYTTLKQNERLMNKSLLRLSTGLRILSAADDASGLFIADQLSLVSTGLQQGNRNIQFAISALQIAEGGVAQIYDKLKTMYQKAVSAANDINDPNARAALQRDIENLRDAIQKIAQDTEYNGIRLLDGTLKNGIYIHYGARSEQKLSVAIDDVRASNLGAYLLDLKGQSNSAYDSFANLLTTDTNFDIASTETISIAGVTHSPPTNIVTDARYIADWINGDPTLQQMGIKAKASNRVVGDPWVNVAVDTGDSLTIKFYVGTSTTPAITLTYGPGKTITLDRIISDINSKATGLNLVAKEENGRLVIETSGETVGVEVSKSGTGGTTFSLDQIISGVNKTVNNTNTQASAIKVGDLRIIDDESYTYDFTGIAGAFGLTSPSGTVGITDLYAIDVTTNEGAELAMDILTIAAQKVDEIRSQIGSTIINLQAIYDAKAVAKDNTDNAENIIRNVDFAKEMTEFTKYQIRMQSGIAMLAQANALPQLVLQLLR